jgi:hypothetical protein
MTEKNDSARYKKTWRDGTAGNELKKKDYEKIQESGDFSPINPYKMETMLVVVVVDKRTIHYIRLVEKTH